MRESCTNWCSLCKRDEESVNCLSLPDGTVALVIDFCSVWSMGPSKFG